MNSFKADSNFGPIKQRIKKLQQQLNRQTDVLDDLFRDAREGNLQASKSGGSLAREIVATTKQLIDAELDLDTQRKRQNGDAGFGAFDFAQARDEICQRLDRLRVAGGSDSVSGQSDT